MRQPRRAEVAQQQLVEITGRRIQTFLVVWKRIQVVDSGVFLDKLGSVVLQLRSHIDSLERTACDTSRGTSPPASRLCLAALHRDQTEREVEAIYLPRCVLLAERKQQLAQRKDRAKASPLVPAVRNHAWASDAVDLMRPVRLQVAV